MKEDIEKFENNFINEKSRRVKNSSKLRSMKSNYEAQKYNYEHKIDYVLNDILKITIKSIEKMRVIRLRNEKK